MEEMAGMGRTTGERSERSGSYPKTWLVDSGATSHMCGDVRLFQSVAKLTVPIRIHLSHNCVTFATQSGDIILSPHLMLTNVLFVPSFTYNLLSVSQLCKALSNLLHSRGIIHQKSCIYTPQQNGVVERKHRHLLQVARALMFQSHLPREFWADSLLAATYIINKLPSASLKCKSPFELLYKGQKAYKVYDIENKRILISRDVVFHEDVFPYNQTISATYTPDRQPPASSIVLPLPSLISDPTPLRRSQRAIRPPTWLNDYHYNLTPDPIVFSSDLTSSHTDFMATLSTIHEPSYYKEARGCEEWDVAMQQELAALEQNDTWEIVDLPLGKHPIGSKWVYKVKLKADGSFEWYKARLVAKGYNQIQGVDYVDRFSPVAKIFVLLLLKGRPYLLARQSQHDLFLKDTTDVLFALLVYVDDVLLTHSSEAQIAVVKRYLDSAFTIKDLGPAKYFLSLEIDRTVVGTSVTQHKFIRDIICDTGLRSAKPVLTPLPTGVKLSAFDSTEHADPEPYRWLVGRLLSQFHSSRHLLWGSAIEPVCPHTLSKSYGARSTAEAEYRSLGTTACELQWISFLLQDFGLAVATPIPLYCDNQAATHIVANPMFHERTKHLEIDCHLVRDHYKAGFLLPCNISGKLQLADMFTKLLPRPAFTDALTKLGLFSPTQVQLEGG
ncbi:UNVERIFIED_CONTAM: Retrovirus-related Pol polyprotein from transposon RE1 [Sesamum latifolium]|uniref:Retrovirus-related Pol polyprotein from transposon RE1 n=1 Tax=Sesamum latifolium TaxID=2727402 RepID=A0AAW2TKV6_9LAMI